MEFKTCYKVSYEIERFIVCAVYMFCLLLSPTFYDHPLLICPLLDTPYFFLPLFSQSPYSPSRHLFISFYHLTWCYYAPNITCIGGVEGWNHLIGLKLISDDKTNNYMMNQSLVIYFKPSPSPPSSLGSPTICTRDGVDFYVEENNDSYSFNG